MGEEEYNEVKKEVDKIKLTDILYCKNRNETYDAFHYLEGKFEGDLDKGFYAVLSYITYPGYEKFKLKSKKGGYGLKNAENCKRSQFYLESEQGIYLSGEVLNNSTPILTKYKTDIGDNGDKKKFSELSKMFFHLVTTVGNVMPWPKNFNPVTGNKLDIFQKKFPMYLSLYEWMRMVGKLDEDWEYWIKGFVDNHYLQDFVDDDKTKALRFLNLDKIEEVKKEIKEKKKNIEKAGEKEKEEMHKKIEGLEKVWNLYFYRASKAIMKRSYRILKNKEIKDEELSEAQENEFNKEFKNFCEECNVKEELEKLKEYLDKHEDEKIKCNEIDEIKKLIDKL